MSIEDSRIPRVDETSEDPALEVLVEYFQDLAPGARVDVAPLCALHPEHASALRSHADAFARKDRAFRAAEASILHTDVLSGESTAMPPWSSRAIDVYHTFLKARKYSRCAFEELKLLHPRLATDLDRLHGHWAKVTSALKDCGAVEELDSTTFLHGARRLLVGADQARTRELVDALFERRDGAEHYVVHGEIGQGGMGTVFEVGDPVLRRRLAMKIPDGRGIDRASLLTGESIDRMTTRFLEEAQVTGQLDHPNIVPVHELGINDRGQPFFTMKLVKDGQTLAQVFQRARRGADGWTQSRVLDALLRVCDAMSYAHAKGVVHRDLKPSNIMVGRFGEVLVMDWGLAQIVQPTHDQRRPANPAQSVVDIDADETDAGQLAVTGTPWFMAPEQAAGSPIAAETSVDIYAMGAILYTFLAGVRPFEETDSSPDGSDRRVRILEVLRRVREEAPVSLETLAGRSVAPELIAIAEKAMSRRPADRYPTALDLADDVRRYIDDRVVLAHRTGPIAELGKWSRRNRSHALASVTTLGATLLGLMALSGILQAQKQDAVHGEQSALEDLVRAETESRLIRDAARVAADEAKALARQAQAELQDSASKLATLNGAVLREENRWRRLAIERRAQELLESSPRRHRFNTDHRAALQAWLLQAEAALKTVPSIRADRTALLAEAPAMDAATAAEIQQASPLAGQFASQEALVTGLQRDLLAVEDALLRDPANPRAIEMQAIRASQLERARATLEQRRTALENVLPIRFEDSLLQWKFEIIERRLRAADQLGAERSAVEALSQRQHAAEAALRADASRWQKAIDAIADAGAFPLYDGARLTSQPGLRPLGPLERNGERLYQFTVLGTGTEPSIDPSGDFRVDANTAVVMVLLPPGEVHPGCAFRGSDESTYEVDPKFARSDEAPDLHPIQLNWFFMARHEMTQGQWSRMTNGDHPSLYREAVSDPRRSIDATHPVETVNWYGAQSLLHDWGLDLPTEAQWEYAVRIGGQARRPFWAAATKNAVLRDVIPNLADARMARDSRRRIDGWRYEPGYAQDDHDYHAPVADVGSVRHPFGLERMLGNVAEWCRDPYLERYAFGSASPGDGYRSGPDETRRVVRGGSFKGNLLEGRSARRRWEFASSHAGDVGVRACRPVEPLGRDQRAAPAHGK